jgi:hypothetical protein
VRRSAGPLGGALWTGAFLVDMEAGTWKMVMEIVGLLMFVLFSSFCGFCLSVWVINKKVLCS